ncbi:MAG: hypothetical protein IJT94_00320 [Oscillibacter sp.]|nr:hypothetical protein [Oscillibacter sp.]
MMNLFNEQRIREIHDSTIRAESRAEGHAKSRAEGHAKGRAEGHAKGRAEGHAKGRREEKNDVIVRMIRENETVDRIMAYTDAPRDTILSIASLPGVKLAI